MWWAMMQLRATRCTCRLLSRTMARATCPATGPQLRRRPAAASLPAPSPARPVRRWRRRQQRRARASRALQPRTRLGSCSQRVSMHTHAHTARTHTGRADHDARGPSTCASAPTHALSGNDHVYTGSCVPLQTTSSTVSHSTGAVEPACPAARSASVTVAFAVAAVVILLVLVCSPSFFCVRACGVCVCVQRK